MNPRGTAAQRLRTAFALYEFAEAMVRQKARLANPEATDHEIESFVQRWREDRPGAEWGDAVGRPRAWPAHA